MTAPATSPAPRTIRLSLWSIFCLSWMGPSLPGSDAADLNILHQDLSNLVQPRSLGLVALGVGAAAFGHQWDDELRGDLSNQAPIERLMDVGNTYGSTTYSLLATGGLWAVASAAGLRSVRPVASETLRAIVLANILVTPLKFGVGRERPDASNKLSFPSGHTANAFALTAVLTRRYGWRLGLPLYTLAAFVPPARIEREKHYFSDVVGGAVLGSVAGWAVTRSSGNRNEVSRRVMVVPLRTSGYTVIKATVSL